jgi:hypothetical protein
MLFSSGFMVKGLRIVVWGLQFYALKFRGWGLCFRFESLWG